MIEAAPGIDADLLLADRLAAQAERLALASLAPMYADPFWDERFGARGRKFAEEDARHHVGYLVEALRAGSAAPLETYARWLRSVLVPRGMCSEDLRENFARLDAALATVPGAAPAQALLRGAAWALRHEGAAGRLEAHGERLVRRAAGDQGADLLAGLHADPRHLLSYLADAVAGQRPDWLGAHLAWAGAALTRRGEAALLPAALDRLGAALAEGGPPEATATLAEARKGAGQ